MRLAINIVGVIFVTAACWQFLDRQYLPAALLGVGGVAMALLRHEV